MMNEAARQICETLGLAPHPEGGWYRETWRAGQSEEVRAAGTAIHFLLSAGERSHWHKIDATEIWLWHDGDPLALRIAGEDERTSQTIQLGGDVCGGCQPQAIVPPHAWQAAEPMPGDAGYCLVSCIVVPGFEFAGFRLAPEDWAPNKR